MEPGEADELPHLQWEGPRFHPGWKEVDPPHAPWPGLHRGALQAELPDRFRQPQAQVRTPRPRETGYISED